VDEQTTTESDTVAASVRPERWGWLSLLVDFVLVGVHGILAIASGSFAVSAEVIHNLFDLLGAAAVLMKIRLA
jgi:divalent metal cation (Fe/Co/Zn/Cd) transporter